jgi:hypothetical protein
MLACDSDLLALFNGKPSIDPVQAEIVRNVQNLQLGESHAVKGIVSRPKGRAMVPGAAPAIEYDEFVARQRFHPLAEFLQLVRLGSRANVF